MNIRQRLAKWVVKKLAPEILIERRQYKREAETDPLTGLRNKRAWLNAKGSVESDPKKLVVIWDVNNFGVVNKSLSTEAGDRILVDIARAIKAVMPRTFRIGGDEFVSVVEYPAAHIPRLIKDVRDIFGTNYICYQGSKVIISLSGSFGLSQSMAEESLQEIKVLDKMIDEKKFSQKLGLSQA